MGQLKTFVKGVIAQSRDPEAIDFTGDIHPRHVQAFILRKGDGLPISVDRICPLAEGIRCIYFPRIFR